MESYDPFGSPSAASAKADTRWGREEDTFASRAVMDSYRRRSPSSQGRRRSSIRGRSRSPVAIDRYQPGDRERASRGDDYYAASRDLAARDREERRRLPSPVAANIDRYVPGQDSTKPILRTNPLPNPLSLDFQVGFNWFAEWWRADQAIKEEKERAKLGGRRPSDRVKGEREAREDREKERAQIQAAYDTYKAELQIKMARAFVQQHKAEEWFKERYIPETRDPIRQRLMEFRTHAYRQWEQDIDSGVFDEFTLEGIYKSESDGAGGIIEKEEGEATAVGETLSVLDLVPARGGDLRDDSLLQPALLIKTLAPNVSRDKIEDFCKEHLGEGDGGFKWLSLSDPNPTKKCHRMGWIMLHPSEVGSWAIERSDGRDEEGEEGDGGAANGSASTSTAEKALEAVNGKTIHDLDRGDFVCHVGVHIPPTNPRKKALWDLFSAPERIERDLELAKRLVSKLDSELGSGDGLSKIESRVEDLQGRGLLHPPVTGSSKEKEGKPFETDVDMILSEDGEAEEGEEQEESYDEEVDSEELLVKKKQLDLLVEYLRRVYNFCFFCVFESDSIHELVRKCPGGHLRRPRSGLSTQAKAAAKASALGLPFPTKKKETTEEDQSGASPVDEKEQKQPHFSSKAEQQTHRAFNWVRTFEDKLLQLLEPENVDLRKLGGKPVDEAVEEELSKFVKQEDEAKFRCKVPECTKLFKAHHFWRKHVEKRHPDWYSDIRRDLFLVNAYVLDPAHISPSRSDPTSNGHFPYSSGHMPTGTPRGFNLANMPFSFGAGNGSMPGGSPFSGLSSAAGFTGFMNAAGHPGGWAGSGLPLTGAAGSGDPSALHHPGVIRRGNRYGGNRTGPYDRRGGRFGSGGAGGSVGGNGRLSPGMSAAGGRLPSGAGAAYIPLGHPAAAAASAGVGPRWGDSSGGSAQAMGPTEAVQGRSLKSYEDLDAVGGPGSGELNY
ncbi:arsenite resistance protein Ars2 [Histoplasma capsulatum var. duboisii H88]|uniref:Arsenite resistance protein Ars2 n=2 Tax=Ajellomyces capsulatus (strain H88) TaxID=544711 RepID=A0A8A1LIS2_AJEC8|nr:arsenite resistance protein Ars2 [Histoplasma capsulatum var. duboisii H88]